jgi:hypothetical protein
MGQQEIAALQNFNPAYEPSAVSLDRPQSDPLARSLRTGELTPSLRKIERQAGKIKD